MPRIPTTLLGVSRWTTYEWRRRGISSLDELARLVGARALAVVAEECPSNLYVRVDVLPRWLRRRLLRGRLRTHRWRVVPMVCLEDVIMSLPPNKVNSIAWWGTRLEPIEVALATELFSTFLAWRTAKDMAVLPRYMAELREAIRSVYAKYASGGGGKHSASIQSTTH